tara:strand:+ start:379 stop:666 length:288 start_codon:yes stop_codon:yes gene_type:complete
MKTMENPPHLAPEGFEYWSEDFNAKFTRIWIRNKTRYFTYCGGHPSSIWGFVNKKTGAYYSPINHKKVGKVVDIALTSPYSAMVLELNPLMAAFQ